MRELFISIFSGLFFLMALSAGAQDESNESFHRFGFSLSDPMKIGLFEEHKVNFSGQYWYQAESWLSLRLAGGYTLFKDSSDLVNVHNQQVSGGHMEYGLFFNTAGKNKFYSGVSLLYSRFVSSGDLIIEGDFFDDHIDKYSKSYGIAAIKHEIGLIMELSPRIYTSMSGQLVTTFQTIGEDGDLPVNYIPGVGRNYYDFFIFPGANFVIGIKLGG
jgi:hypothetical protein